MANLESVDGTTVLGEDDIMDVRMAVADLAVRWQDLGISLGIRLIDLDTILSHSSSDYLREMLTLWLRQYYNVKKFGMPTWRRLIEAVQEPFGGNNPALAYAIARDHPSLSPLNWDDGVPTLRDLSLLSVPNWYLLGLQLGVSADELDVIERNYPRDNHMCKVKMFGAWLRVDTSASYRKLARALVAIGKRNIAEAMCTARGIPLTVLDDSLMPVSAGVLLSTGPGTYRGDGSDDDATFVQMELRDIQNELRDVTDWYQLGVQLGIKTANLDEIRVNNPHNAQQCKTKVLDFWLQNATECSWVKLAEAVEAMGGYAVLAEKLRKKTSQAAHWTALMKRYEVKAKPTGRLLGRGKYGRVIEPSSAVSDTMLAEQDLHILTDILRPAAPVDSRTGSWVPEL